MASQDGGHAFNSGFAHSEGDGEDFFGEPRRIACKRCNSFHIWLQTKKPKSRARWCQVYYTFVTVIWLPMLGELIFLLFLFCGFYIFKECKDFHQAKDGDGWLEQAFHPLLFGLLQKVTVPGLDKNTSLCSFSAFNIPGSAICRISEAIAINVSSIDAGSYNCNKSSAGESSHCLCLC